MAPIVIKQRSTGNLFADSYRVILNGGLGREYYIKGLHSLLSSRNCPRGIEVPKEVKEDLSQYERHRDRKKRQFSGKKKSRLEQEL